MGEKGFQWPHAERKDTRDHRLWFCGSGGAYRDFFVYWISHYHTIVFFELLLCSPLWLGFSLPPGVLYGRQGYPR